MRFFSYYLRSLSTTATETIIDSIANILPEPYERAAYFEISAAARNQPRSDYKMVTMFVNQNFVDLQKVTTPTKKVVEVDWVSLNSKFDFQLSLSTETLIKHDVKPFNAFIKKVSVRYDHGSSNSLTVSKLLWD